jgi:hypothetical protein
MHVQVRRGVMAEECGSLVKRFFQKRRLEKSNKDADGIGEENMQSATDI